MVNLGEIGVPRSREQVDNWCWTAVTAKVCPVETVSEAHRLITSTWKVEIVKICDDNYVEDV